MSRTKPNSRARAPKKCKAPKGPAPATRAIPAWLRAVAADALRTDLAGAADRAGVTLTDIHQARQRSPEADALITEVDQATRLRARAAVEALAAKGDLRAVRALTDGTLTRLDGRSDEPEPLPPHVAAAMMRAGLEALGLEEPPAAELGRLCSRCGGFEPTSTTVYFPDSQRADPVRARTATPPSLKPGRLGST